MSKVKVTPNGLYTWFSGDAERGDACLEISRETRDEIGIRINSRNSYTPVSLTVAQAEELVEALRAGKDVKLVTVSPYGITSITLTVTHEPEDIVFLARFKNSLNGHAVSYSEVPDMVEALTTAIDVTVEHLQTKV